MSRQMLAQGIEKPIPLSEPEIGENAWLYVKDALDSGWVSSVGPYVDRFERAFADYFQVPRTVATVNGTAALHIALLLAGVQPGDEVVVPSLTFIATVNAIRYVGAVPVFWDSQSDHWNADPALLESLITPKTKAIIAVHLYGDAMEMGAILSIARRHGLKVIEDAAEALGAEWQGQRCGSIGDIGCLSFNGNKTLTTGGGGLLISQDEALMDRAHYLINQAKDDASTFTHHEVGYNYRLTNLQAALGVSQLEQLPALLARRRAVNQRYQAAFAGHPLLHTFTPPANTTSACWLYGIALKADRLPNRTALNMVSALEAANIQSRTFFKPGHLQKPFQPFVRTSLPHAESWHHLGFNLPSSSTLHPEQQERVIETVLETLSRWEADC
jgi:perosamine synthetase